MKVDGLFTQCALSVCVGGGEGRGREGEAGGSREGGKGRKEEREGKGNEE